MKPGDDISPLKDIFESAKRRALPEDLQRTLKIISKAVHDLRSIGADISIDLKYGSHENAEDMVRSYEGWDWQNKKVMVYGFIRTGQSSFMLALTTSHRYTNPAVFISTNNIHAEWERTNRKEPGYDTIQSKKLEDYSFKNFEEKLRQTLAELCAGTQAILDNDPHEALNQEMLRKPDKPGAVISLNKPSL